MTDLSTPFPSYDLAAFTDRLAAVAAEVEDVLDALLGEAALPDAPQRLVAAMRHATLGGGKRLRAFLAVETGRLAGANGQAALRIGAALECVHAYSLVHDDLPAMDDDDMRRGKPTVHRAFDEATAILAGDALLTLVFAVMADPVTHADGAVRAELVLTLARAAGAAGMVGGQMLDLAAEGRFGDGGPLDLDASAIRRLQAMKTGALLAAAVESGAILAGATPAVRSALLAYGRALGAAFQVADDLLDVEASAADLGKATGKDADKGKGTLVAALGRGAARTERDRLAADAIDALKTFGGEADMLRAAAVFAALRTT